MLMLLNCSAFPMATKKPTLAEMREIAKALEELEHLKLTRKMDFYVPYDKQKRFMDLGLTKRERLFRAGNQLGKTLCGSMEAAYHLTGEYPEWWAGRRFTKPVKMWVACNTGLNTRDGPQKYLCGEPGVESAQGTGSIPMGSVNWKTDISLARGVTDLYDTVQVTHKTKGKVDGKSIVRFKTYEQGREKWQGETLDLIWFDEEPPLDIYTEGLTRITATDGMVYITFTPLKGKSDVVIRFMNETSPYREEVNMTMDDAKHIPESEREKIVSSWPAYQRKARRNGIPMEGEGRVFEIDFDVISEARPEEYPLHWWYGWGLDFGIAHPFAAVLMGWDKDADCIHVLHAIRMSDTRPIDHAQAMKPNGGWKIPCAWPQDGHQRQTGSLEHMYALYKKEGLRMMTHHATHPDGSNSTEAGLAEMVQYMTTGRFKVAKHLAEWIDEFHSYHRKDGLIVKERDDLMSATRVGFMMRRHFKQLEFLGAYTGQKGKGTQIAGGAEPDAWGA